ncbi:putative nuclease HARBI1 [Coccinella septempunctata]|uniref:putative nuclease HARBI1 n=1 Tax=Coccinella septempunctata TaxID=41139 RepID=UPI001D087097|nr:putative nuclease HARBI1 [Coccinella septempunctata]
MLANQEVYRSVADRFNVSLSTAWEYFQRVVNVLVEVSSIYIKWPESYENITRKFKKRGGIDGVIGAIDGTHISITTPSYMSNKYLNRKQYHSIVLQGVCDASYIFTDCFTGCPGSVHDARVYRMSPLFKQIMPNITRDYHLLGDSAYPNATNLITPYRDNGHLTRHQRPTRYENYQPIKECTSKSQVIKFFSHKTDGKNVKGTGKIKKQSYNKATFV